MTYFNSGASAIDKMWIFKIMRADQSTNKIALEVKMIDSLLVFFKNRIY